MDLSDFYDREWFLEKILERLESNRFDIEIVEDEGNWDSSYYNISNWKRLESKSGDLVSVEDVKDVIKDFLLEFDGT